MYVYVYMCTKKHMHVHAYISDVVGLTELLCDVWLGRFQVGAFSGHLFQAILHIGVEIQEKQKQNSPTVEISCYAALMLGIPRGRGAFFPSNTWGVCQRTHPCEMLWCNTV